MFTHNVCAHALPRSRVWAHAPQEASARKQPRAGRAARGLAGTFGRAREAAPWRVPASAAFDSTGRAVRLWGAAPRPGPGHWRGRHGVPGEPVTAAARITSPGRGDGRGRRRRSGRRSRPPPTAPPARARESVSACVLVRMCAHVRARVCVRASACVRACVRSAQPCGAVWLMALAPRVTQTPREDTGLETRKNLSRRPSRRL